MDPVDYISMNEDALWECDFCGRIEFDNSKLKRHIEKDHEDPQKGKQTRLNEVKA